MKVISRFRWKIRRTIKNFKRIVALVVVLGIAGTLYHNSVKLPDMHTVEQWLNKGLLITGGVIGAIIFSKVLRFLLKQRKFRRSNIRQIDSMSGEEFEHYLGFLFSKLGYKAKVTQLSGDYGADVVIKKDGIKTVIQAKRYRNKVDNKAIQEIVTSKSVYQADRAMYVTNSHYTKPAIELAKANDVELWDRDKLIKELSRLDLRKEIQSDLAMSNTK